MTGSSEAQPRTEPHAKQQLTNNHSLRLSCLVKDNSGSDSAYSSSSVDGGFSPVCFSASDFVSVPSSLCGISRLRESVVSTRGSVSYRSLLSFSGVPGSQDSTSGETSFSPWGAVRWDYRFTPGLHDRLSELKSDFLSWQNEVLYYAFEDVDTGDVHYSKCPKRGNDVYRYLLNVRLSTATSFMSLPGFSDLTYSKGGSNAFFITLTYGRSGLSLQDAWERVGSDYNLFRTKFVQHYGRAFMVQVPQAHRDGFPHIHILVISPLRFPAFLHSAKGGKEEGKVICRLEAGLEMASLWSHGFVDVRGCRSVESVKRYLFRDLFKPDSLSQALSWAFSKRAFSVSHPRVIEEVLGSVGLDLLDLINGINNSKVPLPPGGNYQFLGVFHLRFMDGSVLDPPFSFVVPYSGRPVVASCSYSSVEVVSCE